MIKKDGYAYITSILIANLIIIVLFNILNDSENNYLLYSSRLDNLQAEYTAEALINILKSGSYKNENIDFEKYISHDRYIPLELKHLENLPYTDLIDLIKEDSDFLKKNSRRIAVKAKYKGISVTKSIYINNFNDFYLKLGNKLDSKSLKNDRLYQDTYSRLYNYNIGDYSDIGKFSVKEFTDENVYINSCKNKISFAEVSSDSTEMEELRFPVIICNKGRLHLNNIDGGTMVFAVADEVEIHGDTSINGVLVVRDRIISHGKELKINGGFYTFGKDMEFKGEYDKNIISIYRNILPNYRRVKVLYISS